MVILQTIGIDQAVDGHGESPSHEGGNPESVNLTITGSRQAVGTEINSFEPTSWEECCDTTQDGTRIIDFQKAAEYLRTKKSIGDFCPELQLALSTDPVKDGPFGLEMQSFPIGKVEQKKMINQNLMFLFRLGIIEAGFPKELDDQVSKLAKQLIRNYKHNLARLRDEHKEVETKSGKFAVRDVIKKFGEIRRLDLDDTNNEKILMANLTYDEALTVARERVTPNWGTGQTLEDRSARIPLSFLRRGAKETVLRLLLLLDSLGEIELGEMSGQELLDIFQILKWSNYKTTNFLNMGEEIVMNLQKKTRKPEDTEDFDKAGFAKALEILNFYELLEFAMNPNHPIDWRNQAILRAFSKLKFIRIRTNTEYRNAEEAAAAMAAAREAFEFERNEFGDLEWVYFTFFQNENGDRSATKSEAHRIEVKEQARKWKSPLSEVKYAVYFFGKDPIKDKLSVALKGHLQNSSGNPEKLLDIVRDSVVIYPIDENGQRRNDVDRETLTKDKMYFLYSFMKKIEIEEPGADDCKMGVSMKQKSDAINLDDMKDWESNTAQQIYDSLESRKVSPITPGTATIEDTELRGLNRNSNALFRCMKMLFRMPNPIKTGCEFQMYDPEDYCEVTSDSSPANHEIYKYVRSLELHGNFYPGQYFPGTQLTGQALKLYTKTLHLRYMKRKTGEEKYEKHATLLDKKIALLTKIRRTIENGERGGHCQVELASNDDLYELGGINAEITELKRQNA